MPLTDAQLRFFELNGYVIVDDIVPHEVMREYCEKRIVPFMRGDYMNMK